MEGWAYHLPMIVDSAIYVDGHRDASGSLEEIREIRQEKGGFAWIGLYEPTRAEFVVIVRYGETNELVEVRRWAESRPELLRKGPYAVLYAIMDRIVEDYLPVVAGPEHDIDEIEVEVFGNKPDVSRRIYELFREVIQFHQATQPLAGALERLTEVEAHEIDPEVRRYL